MTPVYEEHPPPAAIAAHVHCLWRFAGVEAGVEQAVPPDGRCELIAHVGVPYEERDGAGVWRRQATLLFAGQLTRPLVLRAHGAVAVFAVRFTPAGAWAFTGRALSTCTDRRVDLLELDEHASVAALHHALRTAGDAASALAALAAYVERRIAAHESRRDASVERCVEQMLASEGRVALAELVALSGSSERQLQRRFAEVVGISPRALAIVVRLRRLFDAVRDTPLSTWSERAQAAGFFDHPQMARDFRRLIGLAPRQWAAVGRGLSASLVESDA
jgi:methylphosphotriester-DNA--protein-cysteine methyltransferase